MNKEEEEAKKRELYTVAKCQKCGAICTAGLLNPKTQLCTVCDKEYEPAEWWWMDWKLKGEKGVVYCSRRSTRSFKCPRDPDGFKYPGKNKCKDCVWVKYMKE